MTHFHLWPFHSSWCWGVLLGGPAFSAFTFLGSCRPMFPFRCGSLLSLFFFFLPEPMLLFSRSQPYSSFGCLILCYIHFLPSQSHLDLTRDNFVWIHFCLYWKMIIERRSWTEPKSKGEGKGCLKPRKRLALRQSIFLLQAGHNKIAPSVLMSLSSKVDKLFLSSSELLWPGVEKWSKAAFFFVLLYPDTTSLAMYLSWGFSTHIMNSSISAFCSFISFHLTTQPWSHCAKLVMLYLFWILLFN